MKIPRSILALAALALVGACGAPDEEDTSATGDEIAETDALFGDDRVADVLAGRPDLVPGTFQEFEELFEIGRSCPRTDSKEMYVLEEQQTRADGPQNVTSVLPRAVVTGCNTGDRSDPESMRRSFELMVALFSSTNIPAAAKGDPMVFSPVEVMALDRKTGTYNFYVLGSNEAGRPATVTRIMRTAEGKIVEHTRRSNEASRTVLPARDKRCFSCHVNGGPLMNELTTPWTNWVSVRKDVAAVGITGETRDVISESSPTLNGQRRSSFANDLEPVMRAAIATWIEGAPNKGFGPMTLEGTAPGGLPRLLESSFCQTELNYVSAADVVPIELFVDPDATAGAELVAPPAPAGRALPFQLPVRSEHDRRVERFLAKRGYLSPRTMLAIRLVDDEHAIFSPARCSLHAELTKSPLPDEPAAVDRHIRDFLRRKIEHARPGSARAIYIDALLDDDADEAVLAAARGAYALDLTARYARAVSLLDTPEGRAALAEQVKLTKAAARRMHPGPKSPLPVLE